MRKYLKRLAIAAVVLFAIIMLLPGSLTIPVKGANSNDWNPQSFWYYPWGTSGTHKGIDIFKREGTDVVSASTGIVIYKGCLSKGGNVVTVLGPKLRLCYYAHLKSSNVGMFSFVKRGDKVGEVGTTGNAKGKPAHLHFAVLTPLPYFWLADTAPQGYLKMYYLNPAKYFKV
jgi:murein DD-endopeptidase MepM/ murein hydrolase activator NlpD